ncbi:MAG: GntR family transcriptional regulator [Anaerolineae bacterium]|nr:GntR family transcriptional regulator [Anaerolineae bacterium]
MKSRLRSDNRPLYVRAVEALKTMIVELPYAPGDQLPPETALAAQLGISRTTLRMALGHLEMQGSITRKQGVGTFVAHRPVGALQGGMQTLHSVQSLARAAGLTPHTVDRTVSIVQATPEYAVTLDVAAEADLCQVACTIVINEKPVAYLESLIPAARVSVGVLHEATGSLLDYLIQAGNSGLSHTHSRIYAIGATPELARKLNIVEGQALIHLIETYFSAESEPVGLSHNYFVSDRFGFYITRQIAE